MITVINVPFVTVTLTIMVLLVFTIIFPQTFDFMEKLHSVSSLKFVKLVQVTFVCPTSLPSVQFPQFIVISLYVSTEQFAIGGFQLNVTEVRFSMLNISSELMTFRGCRGSVLSNLSIIYLKKII